MSYLAPLRLHFSGRFQAAPSTVNNDPNHYNNETFQPEFQLPGNDGGSWNPRGNADWRLLGCRVSSAFGADGQPVWADDPVLGLIVADSDRQVAAKLVDLDPEQQLVSTIWGLEVRIAQPDGSTVVRGRFAAAPFTDIWDRAKSPGTGGDLFACAAYQSVLTEIEWSDVSGSAMLTQLQAASAGSGLLSIKFNVDGYNLNATSPNFTTGRIVGTIGAAGPNEPRHFVAGRQMLATASPQSRFFDPAGAVNFCPAVVDEEQPQVLIDLGNALQTTLPGGPLENNGTLTLSYQPTTDAVPTMLGTIDYLAASWYERTAGVVALPATPEQLTALEQAALVLTLSDIPTPTSEAADGRYVRADELVHRLDPGETVEVAVVATRFGRPEPAATIIAVNDPSGLQQAPPGTELAVSYPQTLAPTDERGRTTLAITASDPGNPRQFIDGQIYGVRVLFSDTPASAVLDPWLFVNALVFDKFVPHEPITWNGDLHPIFQQYANLYPVMDLFLDLSDYESVCANRELLRLAFGLDVNDPNAMPVTRDLSKAKRAAILTWLDTPGSDGKPLLGEVAPPAGPRSAVRGEIRVEEVGASEFRRRTSDGGKAAAVDRRFGSITAQQDGGQR